MKIEYEGRVYEFDVTRLSVPECEAIEKFVPARGLGEWSGQLQAANTKALRALWWAVRRHAGEDPGAIGAADPAFLPIAFSQAYAAAEAAEEAKAEAAAKAAEADPTNPPPARSSPGSAATTTTPASGAVSPSLPG